MLKMVVEIPPPRDSQMLVELKLAYANTRRALILGALLVVALWSSNVAAQELKPGSASDPAAVRFGEAISTRYRVGAKVSAKGSDVHDIYIMVAVPLECAEQEVHILEEDISPQVTDVQYRTLPTDKRAEPGARQMLITIPQLAAGQDAQALITYEVVTKAILPPEETASLKIPTKVDVTIKPFLTASPFINVNHRKVRDAVREALAKAEKGGEGKQLDAAGDKKADGDANPTIISSGDEDAAVPKKDAEVKPASASDAPSKVEPENAKFKTGEEDSPDSPAAGDGKLNDWQRVEAFYDYVQEHIKYEAGAPDKSALQTIDDGHADCHGLAALFVAMCRTAKVPARMVWVDGHQYAEFYLEDEAHKGHWYPVQSAGTRAFGEMPVPKVILQKGDKFVVPERRREQLRYASDYTMLKAESGNKPTVKYVREQL
jgi:hypothetical protein